MLGVSDVAAIGSLEFMAYFADFEERHDGQSVFELPLAYAAGKRRRGRETVRGWACITPPRQPMFFPRRDSYPTTPIELGNITTVDLHRSRLPGLRPPLLIIRLRDGTEYLLRCRQYDVWLSVFTDRHESQTGGD